MYTLFKMQAIRGGILQNIRYMPTKNIAFIMFACPNAALEFHQRASTDGLVVKNKRCKIGWGKAQALTPLIQQILETSGSRNVYIGGIDHTVTEQSLRNDFAVLGEIELINIVSDRNIAFVNYTDIMSAIKAVEFMKTHPTYAPFKINYGKDRCGNPPRSFSQDGLSSPSRELSC